MVRISACHVEGPGSIPGRGEIFSFSTKSFSLSTKSVVAPGEARTHNPGITLCTVYKYRALTDCATGAHWQKGLMQGVGFEPSQSYDYEGLNLGHPANLALVEKAATRPIAVSEVWGCSSVVERSIRIRDARGSIPLISNMF